MLLLPNVVYQLFAATGSSNEDDVEKSQTIRRVEADNLPDDDRTNNPRRPPTLVMQEDRLNVLLDGPGSLSDGGTTRRHRILPIFSGIMIPFSIMLSIPSLTGHWYIRTGDNNVTIEIRPNPLLLNAAMGISMGCGVLASACLVVRFTERSVKLMTSACIVFLSFHDLINIPAITIFGIQHRFDDGFTYGQSFWMTVCSTIASTATNITLIIDYVRTVDFAQSGSGLTRKQRSLVVIIIVLLCYVSLGSLIQAIMLGITFIDALYFTVASIETVGFGDIHPTSTGTRVFTCCYITGGILNLALAVTMAREALLEAAAVGFQSRLKAVRARQQERRVRGRWRAAIRWRLRTKGLQVWVDQHSNDPEHIHHRWFSIWRACWSLCRSETTDPAWRFLQGPRHKRLNVEALTMAQLEAAALEAGAAVSELVPKEMLEVIGRENVDRCPPISRRPPVEAGMQLPSLTHVRIGGMISLLGRFLVAFTHGVSLGHRDSAFLLEGNSTVDDEEEYGPGSAVSGHGVPLTSTWTTQDADDGSLAETIAQEERSAFHARLSVALLLFFIFWMAGSAIFAKTEKWSFGSAVYFCFISFTTVGYGDLYPRTPAGRSIFVVWALLGVGTMTILISILAEAYSTQYKSVIKTEVYETTTAVYENTALTSTSTSMRQRLFDSPTVLNTGTDQDFASPLSAGTSFSLGTPRPGRSRKATVAGPIPKLQLNPQATQETTAARLQEFPRRVLRHAEGLQALMDLERRACKEGPGPNQEAALLSRLENSLQEIVDAANDALQTEIATLR